MLFGLSLTKINNYFKERERRKYISQDILFEWIKIESQGQYSKKSNNKNSKPEGNRQRESKEEQKRRRACAVSKKVVMLRRSFTVLYGSYVATGIKTVEPRTLNDVTLNFRRTEEAARKAEEDKVKKGFFSLPNLMYPVDRGISPVMSAKQVSFVRNVYHKDAVDTLNLLSLGSEFEGHPLDVVIRTTSFDAANAALHSAAAEHFNHSFSFRSISPFGAPAPQSVANAIHLAFSTRGTEADHSKFAGEVDLNTPFERQVLVTALNHQAKSGWLYLLRGPNGLKLRVYNHGTCPLSGDSVPLLCINLHDHAYCLDYSTDTNGLAHYLKNCLQALNWNTPQRYLNFAEGTKTLDLLSFDQL